MTGEKAIRSLQDKTDEIMTLRRLQPGSQEFNAWRRNTRVALERIFADDKGKHKDEFEVLFRPLVLARVSGNDTSVYQHCLDFAKTFLESVIKEIKDWEMPAHKEVKQTEGEGDGIITPKPPDILAKILWILRYWRKWWWLLLLALLLIVLSLMPKFTCSKEDKNSHVQGETSSEKQSKEKRLQVTLTGICADIDSRPLAQQAEMSKQYSGMMIKRERLRVHEIHINLGDESIYDLRLILPDEPSSPNSKWIILCTVSKDKYPQLRIAKEGMEFYVSGEIAMTFWRFGERHIMLSNVTLEFE